MIHVQAMFPGCELSTELLRLDHGRVFGLGHGRSRGAVLHHVVLHLDGIIRDLTGTFTFCFKRDG